MAIRIGKRVTNPQVVLRTAVAVVALLLLWAPPTLAHTAIESATFTRNRITSPTGSHVQGITLDWDGNPWFASGTGTIGRLNRQTGTLRLYNLANPMQVSATGDSIGMAMPGSRSIMYPRSAKSIP